MSTLSNETVVAIVFGIIMTIIGILAWLDGRRRSKERGTTLHIFTAATKCTDADRSSTQSQIPRTLSSHSESVIPPDARPTGVFPSRPQKAVLVLGHL